MARRQRFFHTDYFSLILTLALQAGQAQADFGQSIANAWGNDLTGVTVGPFWMRWEAFSVDTGTDNGGIAVGICMAQQNVEAVDQAEVHQHNGRYVLHDAIHAAEQGTAGNLMIPFTSSGALYVESKAMIRVPRVDDTLFIVAGQESPLNINIRGAVTAMVMMP